MKLNDLYVRARHPRLAPSLGVFSHLTGLERVELFRLARRPGVLHVVEIGSYLGASALALAEGLAAADNATGHVHCIDTWSNHGMAEGPCDTFSQFQANIVPHARRIRPVRGWSTEVASGLLAEIGHIDILFIDGDHSYDGVLADWQTFGPAIAPGGVVAFHDVGWAEGVQRLVNEVVRPRVVMEGGRPNLWWGQLPG